MSDDLVEFLRRLDMGITDKAADEITRLRERLEQAERIAVGVVSADVAYQEGFRAGIEAAAERIESIGFSAGLIRALAEQTGGE